MIKNGDTAQKTFETLTTLIAPYDTTDLIAVVGALQLMPENAARAARLDFVAHAAASRSPQLNRMVINHRQLRLLLNAGPVGYRSLSWHEGPVGTAFTEEFTFYQGSFIVLAGLAPDATFALRHLVEAVFLHPKPLRCGRFRERAYPLLLAALVLSDAVARRAGLVRGLDPAPPDGRDVLVPSRRRLTRLTHAVPFHKTELAAILAPYGVGIEALAPLTIRSGDSLLGAHELDLYLLHARPIVASGDLRIVASPGNLLTAVRHALVNLAKECRIERAVARQYRDFAWATIHEALLDMGVPLLGAPSVRLSIPNAVDGLYQLDTDKLLYTLLVADDLTSYDRRTPHSPWPLERHVARIKNRLRRVRKRLVHDAHPPRGLLSLVLIQGVGRPMMVAIDDAPADAMHLVLVMSAADLETIASLERHDPLALWAFAQAGTRARQHTFIAVAAILDEFSFYRALGYTYPPASDAPHPPPLLMPFAGEGLVRREALRTRDRHGAPFRDGTIEVVAAHHPEQPIYSPAAAGFPWIGYLAEGLPLPV